MESWLAQPESDKIYIADTNFLFHSAIRSATNTDYELLRDLRRTMLSRGCTIMYNSVTRQELLRLVRKLMIAYQYSLGEIDGRKLDPTFKALHTTPPDMNAAGDKFCKNTLKGGYIKFFAALLGESGEWLQNEYNNIVKGCYYKSFGGGLSWETAEQTMAQYGLDSSDAMIVNAGVTVADCVGLLTSDADFKYCYKIENFDIIMPKRLIIPGHGVPHSYDPFERVVSRPTPNRTSTT